MPRPECLTNSLRELLTPAERERFDRAPRFWRASLEDVQGALAAVRRGRVRTFGRTAGGRPLQAAVFGPARAPVTAVYLGGTHAEELAGVAAALDLISLLERGRDLAGRRRPRLRAAARRARVIVVPALNLDGLSRLPARHFERMTHERMLQIALGLWKNGRVPARGPVFRGGGDRRGDLAGRLERLKYLGMRFNDAGCRLNRPASPRRTRSVEVRALARFLAREGADALLDVHCHAEPPAIFLPRPEGVGPAYESLGALAEGVATRVRRQRSYGLRVVPAGKRAVTTNMVYFQRVAGARTLLLELHYRYGRPARGKTSAAEKRRIGRELGEQVDAALTVFGALLEELLARG